MSEITLSAGVRNNLLSLQNTAELMGKTQNRLATGKKVNSALDNPTNFFTAASLHSRSNDLSALLDSMSNGIKTIEAADNGLKALTKTVETMQATLRQARQDKSFESKSFDVDSSGATPGDISFSGGAIGTTPVTVTVAQDDTVDDVIAKINAESGLDGKIRATNDGGKLRIENLSTEDLAVAGDPVEDATVDGNEVRANLATQFNDLRDQLDKLSDDASFNGINLLRGDNLKLTFNETGTSTIDIQAKDGEAINSSNLGIEGVVTTDLDTDSKIDELLGDLKSSLESLRSQASAFGANLSVVQNRTEFTKSMMNTLQTGADNLVLADSNEEGANMLALQTRQQLSTVALSLASQADQAVLRLF